MSDLPEHFVSELPDPLAVKQFAAQFEQNHPSQYRRLLKNDALLSDILTLVAFSPLLSATLLQNPTYVSWLDRRRSDKGVRGREQLLESLARFSLTSSGIEPSVTFARFRRRELLRIYLADIRRQMTVAEITEELSNLADAILEFALDLAVQEMDNRYGTPLERDDRGREMRARSCIVSLGKLGSRELNYASDIDLLFIYSGEGSTSGHGSRGKLTNREYFGKLAEHVSRLVGKQSGEGATFRVDLRLRPHGRVGPLAMSVADTASYYLHEAADWERQVLIRSRASAGDASLFANFMRETHAAVFSDVRSVDAALRSVRRSKQKIDIEHRSHNGFNAKLGRGGIREIEFIAQALQLAYGGRDEWLRAPHTLISLSRLADRGLITEKELPELFGAYEFLRRVEHILQMENGLQTHTVPTDSVRLGLLARRMRFDGPAEFEAELTRHTSNVSAVFQRIFSDEGISTAPAAESTIDWKVSNRRVEEDYRRVPSIASDRDELVEALRNGSPRFAAAIRAREESGEIRVQEAPRDYPGELKDALDSGRDLASSLSALRLRWQALMIEIAALDWSRVINPREAKSRQTSLAEASIAAAFSIASGETVKRFGGDPKEFQIAAMGLGKLGGAALDYDSDLDLMLVFDDSRPIAGDVDAVEFYSRAAEVFVNALSGHTRHGNLYRVDLRLRPHGKNGPNVISRSSFLDYVRDTAAIWELLALVKLRAAYGGQFAHTLERETGAIVTERGSAAANADLAAETRRVRLQLESQRAPRSGNAVNIKYGPGGMLDIYFAIRYLQLRDGVPDDPNDRSSAASMKLLYERGLLTEAEFEAMYKGWEFLSLLDHEMRIMIGRSHVVPTLGNPNLLPLVERIGLTSVDEFLGQLSLHRVAIRDAFDSITA